MRSLPEWIGNNDDVRIPLRVRLRVWQRANGACEKCSHKIAPGEKWQVDHAVALINGGEHRESNMRVLCFLCHQIKTRDDVAEKSKVARVRAKHLGLKKPRTIRAWRKFDGTPVFANRER